MQITITAKDIAIIFVVIASIVIIISGVKFCYGVGYTDGVSSISVVTPTPTVTASQATVAPTTIVFTPISTSMSPSYSVFTTTGQTLICTNYYDWNGIVPQNTYTATISGNVITNIVLISSANRNYNRYDYPWYYYYGGNFYQYDGRRVDQVSYKEVSGRYLRNERPPF